MIWYKYSCELGQARVLIDDGVVDLEESVGNKRVLANPPHVVREGTLASFDILLVKLRCSTAI